MRNKWMETFEVRQCHKTSFSGHNEMMKRFRQLHGKMSMVNPARVNEPDILVMTLPLAIKCVNADSGGLHLPEQTVSRLTSLSLPKVAAYKLLPN